MFEHGDDDGVGAGVPGGTHPVTGVLDAADTAFEHSLDIDPATLDDDQLGEALGRVHGLAAKQAELFARLLGEADTRDLGRRLGASSTTAWARQALLLRPGTAKAAVDLAHRLTPPVPAEDYGANPSARRSERGMPATRDGMLAGDISPEHARVIAKTMADLPTDVTADDAASAEADLAGFAREHDPATLQRLATHLLHVLDAESLEEREERAARKRRLRLIDQHDGTVRITGLLSTEDAATVRTALDPLAAPTPSEDGERDTRRPEQRRADALVELARRALATDELPTNHGHPTQLLLLADLTTLTGEDHTPGQAGSHDAGDHNEASGRHSADNAEHRASRRDGHTFGSGRDARVGDRGGARPGRRARRWLQDTWASRFGVAPAELAQAGPVSTATARRLACHAAITPIVLDPNGVPLRVGRAERSATPGIWTALIARDRGCAFPGCTRPPAWCHAHHLVHWVDGGPTDLDNLVLLCGYHHRTIHHAGWDVRLAPDGHPEFLPPPWIDTDRTPRRNTRPRHNHQPPPGEQTSRYYRRRPPPDEQAAA